MANFFTLPADIVGDDEENHDAFQLESTFMTQGELSDLLDDFYGADQVGGRGIGGDIGHDLIVNERGQTWAEVYGHDGGMTAAAQSRGEYGDVLVNGATTSGTARGDEAHLIIGTSYDNPFGLSHGPDRDPENALTEAVEGFTTTEDWDTGTIALHTAEQQSNAVLTATDALRMMPTPWAAQQVDVSNDYQPTTTSPAMQNPFTSITNYQPTVAYSALPYALATNADTTTGDEVDSTTLAYQTTNMPMNSNQLSDAITSGDVEGSLNEEMSNEVNIEQGFGSPPLPTLASLTGTPFPTRNGSADDDHEDEEEVEEQLSALESGGKSTQIPMQYLIRDRNANETNEYELPFRNPNAATDQAAVSTKRKSSAQAATSSEPQKRRRLGPSDITTSPLHPFTPAEPVQAGTSTAAAAEQPPSTTSHRVKNKVGKRELRLLSYGDMLPTEKKVVGGHLLGKRELKGLSDEWNGEVVEPENGDKAVRKTRSSMGRGEVVVKVEEEKKGRVKGRKGGKRG